MAAAAGLAIALASGAAMAGKDLDAIKARGAVICGVPHRHRRLRRCRQPGQVDRPRRRRLPRRRGRASSATPTKVKYVPLTAQQRFTALQSGEVDLLSRNTTWTLTARHLARPRLHRRHLL